MRRHRSSSSALARLVIGHLFLVCRPFHKTTKQPTCTDQEGNDDVTSAHRASGYAEMDHLMLMGSHRITDVMLRSFGVIVLTRSTTRVYRLRLVARDDAYASTQEPPPVNVSLSMGRTLCGSSAAAPTLC